MWRRWPLRMKLSSCRQGSLVEVRNPRCACAPRVNQFLCAFSPEPQAPLAMYQLPAYGVNLGLSKQEFIHLLKHHPPSSLRGLRTSLIGEADSLDLIPSELRELPLVNRHDSVLRPVTNVLGEDIWTISQSIVNRTSVP